KLNGVAICNQMDGFNRSYGKGTRWRYGCQSPVETAVLNGVVSVSLPEASAHRPAGRPRICDGSDHRAHIAAVEARRVATHLFSRPLPRRLCEAPPLSKRNPGSADGACQCPL